MWRWIAAGLLIACNPGCTGASTSPEVGVADVGSSGDLPDDAGAKDAIGAADATHPEVGATPPAVGVEDGSADQAPHEDTSEGDLAPDVPALLDVGTDTQSDGALDTEGPPDGETSPSEDVWPDVGGPPDGWPDTSGTCECNDGLACTTGACAGTGACAYSVAGDWCVIDGACWPDGAPLPGSDGCLVCSSAVQQHGWTAATGACDDGDACTTGDLCLAGVCVSLGQPDCDDGNPCTDDTCEAALGCTHTPNSAACDDGIPCSGGGHCAESGCQEGGPKYFDRTYGAAQADSGTAVAGLSGDGFAVLGVSANALWLQRLDGGGQPVWSNKLYSTSPSSVITIPTGGFAAAATQTTIAGQRAQIDRWSDAGELWWHHELGQKDTQGADLVGVPSDGGFFLVGSTTYKAAQGYDGWIARTDDYAIQKWSVTVAGLGDDHLLSVAFLPDGGAIAGGATGVDYSTWDGWLVAVDSAGTVTWQKSIPGDGIDVFERVLRLGDGTLLAVGWTTPGGLSSPSDGWVVHTDAEGAVLWERRYGTAFDDRLLDATALADGGFALVGYRKLSPPAEEDAWIVVVGPTGDVRWEAIHGGKGSDRFAEVEEVPGDGLVLVGTTSSAGAGSSDIWVVRTDPWGGLVCDPEGPCFGLAPTECDDGAPCTLNQCIADVGCTNPVSPCDDLNDCTTDACVAETGCQHIPTTDPCIAYGACGTCHSGVCEPQHEPTTFEMRYGDEGVEEHAHDGLVMDDGGFLLVGEKSGEAWVVRTDSAGSLIWESAYGGAKTGSIAPVSPGAQAVLPRPPDGAVMAGTNGADGLKGKDAAWIFAIDGAGTLQWSVVHGTSVPERVEALAPAATGEGYLMGGHRVDPFTGVKGSVIRTDAVGVKVWAQPYGGAKTHKIHDIATLPGAGHILAGEGTPDDQSTIHAWLVRIDDAGTVAWTTYTGDGVFAYDKASAVATLPGDRFVVAGAKTTYADGTLPWLAVFDATTGQLVWERTFDFAPGGAGAVALTPTGGFVLGGVRAVVTRPWFIRSDAWGNPLEQQLLGQGMGSELNAVLTLTDGGAAFVGTSEYVQDAWLGRRDPWGSTTCEQTSACISLGPTDCDDLDACTADGCDPSAGCVHAPLPDGALCGEAASCQAGACAP